MCFCDLVHSFAYYVGYGGDNGSCQAQAALMQFFGVASIMWSAVFAHHLVVVLVRKDPNETAYELYYHVVAWGFPALFLGIALGTAAFDHGVVWCWIGASHPAMRMALYYVPILIVFVFMAVRV